MANGDRAKALKMLEDPDALLKNASVQKIIAEGAQASDLEVVEGQYPEVSTPAEAKPEKEGPGKGAEGAGKSAGRARQKDANNGPASGINGLLLWSWAGRWYLLILCRYAVGVCFGHV